MIAPVAKLPATVRAAPALSCAVLAALAERIDRQESDDDAWGLLP